jgi:hypothetical protein
MPGGYFCPSQRALLGVFQFTHKPDDGVHAVVDSPAFKDQMSDDDAGPDAEVEFLLQRVFSGVEPPDLRILQLRQAEGSSGRPQAAHLAISRSMLAILL